MMWELVSQLLNCTLVYTDVVNCTHCVRHGTFSSFVFEIGFDWGYMATIFPFSLSSVICICCCLLNFPIQCWFYCWATYKYMHAYAWQCLYNHRMSLCMQSKHGQGSDASAQIKIVQKCTTIPVRVPCQYSTCNFWFS